MTRSTLRAVLIGVAIAGATILASVLASAPDGGATRVRTLASSVALPRRATRIEAAQRLARTGAPAVDLPPYFGRLPVVPVRVAIQAGHWQVAALPMEQAHLRDSTGAVSGPWREADINLRIARLAAAELRREGIAVDLLPATVPPGYEADAFVAIHADGGAPGERGWKVAAAWRSSEASRVLARDVDRAYGLLADIPEDRYGVTFLMHGYYAFGWYRYRHAVAPWTPAIIIETGFVTSPLDRRVLVGDPERAASAIAAGIRMFIGREGALPPSAFVPLVYPPMVVSGGQATLRRLPGAAEPVAASLAEGTVVRPLEERGGWYQVMVWGDYRTFGWVAGSDLRPVG